MSDDQDVITLVDGAVGRIRLNRPKALHALTTAMCDAIIAALVAWRADKDIRAVLIDHAEGRGFCAGGDIHMIAQSAAADGVAARAFFFAEYRMNHLLFTFEKPIAAFMDGITMGGGVGLALPVRHRIATERTLFAMPETGIGLFPDVGGGWYLPRLPGRTGAWLATTGARIDGADAKALGLATHYIPSEALDGVKAAILADPTRIAAILDGAAIVPPPSAVEAARDEIDRLFASDRAEDIVAALETDGGAWAAGQYAALRTKSPQTIKVALRQLATGAAFTDFADNMRMEYALGAQIIQRPDFVEGVRAVIVDKDNAPRWNPATLEEVTDHLIDTIFAPLPDDQAWTPIAR